MKNFEIVWNGETRVIPNITQIKLCRADGSCVSLDVDDLTSISGFTPKKSFIKDFNEQYHEICKSYWPKYVFLADCLLVSLLRLGVPDDRARETVNRIAYDMAKSADGALRCWELMDGIYLCVTWHKMELRENYEFVAYVS